MRVLVLEDDLHLAQALAHGLRRYNFVVTIARTIDQALNYASKRRYDVALVDRCLPDGDGIELVKYLHKFCFATRSIILTSSNSPIERLDGLLEGADDYLGKPISLKECVLRIKKQGEKEKIRRHECLTLGQMKLYPENGSIMLGRRSLALRKKEIEILKCLFRHKNGVVSREILIDEVWGEEGELPTYSTIDVYLRRLRMLLGRHSQHIKTIRGFGYAAYEIT